jgi:cysteine synthase A
MEIGNTPLTLLDVISTSSGCQIYGKCEFMNPSGSLKDRTARNLIQDAEAKGNPVLIQWDA